MPACGVFHRRVDGIYLLCRRFGVNLNGFYLFIHHIHKHSEQVDVAFARGLYFGVPYHAVFVNRVDRVNGAVLFPAVELHYLVRDVKLGFGVYVEDQIEGT